MRFTLKHILFLCCLGFLSLLNSCKKEDSKTIIIQGKITDANLQTGVSNAVVTLLASRIQSGTYNPNYIALASTITDVSGNYNIEITKDMDAGFRITVIKTQYFGQTTDINVENLPAGTHNLNYAIYPEAYFKLIVNNSSSVDNNDFISYWFYNTQPAGINCCNNLPKSHTGQTYTDTVICRTFGRQNIIVKWIVKKNNITTPFESAVYCAPFDTTVYPLNY